MTASFVPSFVPGGVAVFVLAPLVMFLAVVVYALRIKSYVHAVFSHGKTTVEFEAEERDRRPQRTSRHMRNISDRHDDGPKLV